MNKPDPFMEGYHLGHKHGVRYACGIIAIWTALVAVVTAFWFFLR